MDWQIVWIATGAMLIGSIIGGSGVYYTNVPTELEKNNILQDLNSSLQEVKQVMKDLNANDYGIAGLIVANQSTALNNYFVEGERMGVSYYACQSKNYQVISDLFCYCISMQQHNFDLNAWQNCKIYLPLNAGG